MATYGRVLVSHQSSTYTTPFKALYCVVPPIHIPNFPRDSNVEAVDIYKRNREEAIDILKQQLKKVTTRMK